MSNDENINNIQSHKEINNYNFNHEKINSYKFSQINETNMKNFNNSGPVYTVRNSDNLSSYKFSKYTGDTYNFADRINFVPENFNPNMEIKLGSQPKDKFSSHFDFVRAAYGAIGDLSGNVLYDLAVNGSTDISYGDVARNIYNATAWEGIQAGTTYGAAYAFGAEVIIPVKVGWAVLDGSSILKHEYDYLISKGIFTAENIDKAKLYATTLAASGAFATELKFATKLGRAVGATTVAATGSFTSRAIRDSYNYEPHKMGWGERIYVFQS